MTDDITNYDPVELPVDSSCPVCGHEATDDSIVEHRLSANGYMHDDIRLECTNEDCDNRWTLGVPLGDFDGGTDLWCKSCDETRYLIHRVRLVSDEMIELHLKCPHCNHFPIPPPRRELHDDIALVGYPIITGSTDGAEPYGYGDEPPA